MHTPNPDDAIVLANFLNRYGYTPESGRIVINSRICFDALNRAESLAQNMANITKDKVIIDSRKVTDFNSQVLTEIMN